MKTKIRLLVLALFPLLILAIMVGFLPTSPMKLVTPARAQTSDPTTPEPVILSDEQEEYPLGLYLKILEDPSGELTIEDVSSPEFDSQFTPSREAVPNFGFTKSAYWVRLSLDNQSQRIDEWLLEQGFANMHYVDLYTPLPDGGGFSVQQTGVLRPPASRDIPHPRIIFSLAIPPQSQQTYYLRFSSGASMTLPLTLWTQKAFLSDSLQEQIAKGIFYGVLIGLLLYNLFLLISLRDLNYLYFVILLASLIIQEASYDGYLGIYLIPNLYFLSEYIHPFSFALLIGSMVLFSDSFLESKTRLPKIHQVNRIILIVWGILMLLSLFISYHISATLMSSFTLLSLLFVAIAGILSWRRGFRPARFFMIAWLGLLGSVFWVILVRIGITPSTFVSEIAYRLGYLWMAVCWSIALADRINLLKAETEDANRNLRNSEYRLSQILEGLPFGVLLYGKDQKPKYTNQRTVEIFNNPAKGTQVDLSAGRTLAQAIQYFSLRAAGNSQEYLLEDFPAFHALQGETAFADDIEMDRGDECVKLEVYASPVLDETGNVESAVVTVQDISQRKREEAELAEYRRHLEMLVGKRTEELTATNEQLIGEAAERKNLELTLQQRIEWLSVVKKVNQTIAGEIGLAAAYEEISASIVQLISARLVLIIHWENQGEQVEVYCASPQRNSTPQANNLKVTFQKDSPLRQDIIRGKIITWSIDQSTPIPGSLEECFQEHDIQSAIFAPILLSQSVVEVLGVAMSRPLDDFMLQQVDLVEKMAFDLAELTQDAIQHDQTKMIITAEERNRLARELHDSVTQTLFTASVLAEATPRIWDRDQNMARRNMDKLSLLIRGALAEMRFMLIELRSEDLQNQTLDLLLNTMVEGARARSHAIITLSMSDIPEIPKNVTLAFYRMAREALNNTLIHSAASQIHVSLKAEPGYVELHIQDNGCGFDPQAIPPGHLGLRILGERAAEIGGRVQIQSEPGYGTDIVITWLSQVELLEEDE